MIERTDAVTRDSSNAERMDDAWYAAEIDALLVRLDKKLAAQSAEIDALMSRLQTSRLASE